MTLVAVVEGEGEVAAVPVLLRRVLGEIHGRWDVQVLKPYRGNRSELGHPARLAQVLERVRLLRPADRTLVLYDADDSCPVELARVFPKRPDLRLAVASREYEAWLLHHDAPETVRGAKEWLDRHHGPYKPTQHQAALTAGLDLEATQRRCPSLRHLVKVVGELVQ